MNDIPNYRQRILCRAIDPEDLETLQRYPDEAIALLPEPFDEIARKQGIAVTAKFLAEYGGVRWRIPKSEGRALRNSFMQKDWLLTMTERQSITDELREHFHSGDVDIPSAFTLRQFCRRKQIIEYLAAGLSIRQVAYIFGLTETSIYGIRRADRARKMRLRRHDATPVLSMRKS